MMGSLIDTQAPLDWALKNGLIEVTPASWHSAQMEIACDPANPKQAPAIAITSPEGRAEVVVPTLEMRQLAGQLAATFSDRAIAWKKVRYTVTRAAGGQWQDALDYQ